MSRNKKSRKINSNGPKLGTRIKQSEEEARLQKRLKKRKGLKAGNRNVSEVSKDKPTSQQGPKDPRLGSKKPIALVPEDNKVEKLSQFKPKAKLAKAAAPVKLSPEKELAQIEDDPKLAKLLDHLDEGGVLSAQDNAWVEAKMARHQALLAELGLLEEDEDESEDAFDTFNNIDTRWMDELEDKD